MEWLMTIDIDCFLALMKYFLVSYVLIWVTATPAILLVLSMYGIPFTTNYEELIDGIPLYLSTTIIYLFAILSYYIPASFYFKKIKRRITSRFVAGTALAF